MQLSNREIQEFLFRYPKMNLLPITNGKVVFEGIFECIAQYKDLEELIISYELRIEIPKEFPKILPKYFLKDSKVKQDIDLHLIGDNKEICLGIELSLMIELNKSKSFLVYTKNVLIPYLYGLTYKLKHGEFPFPEVDHGIKGKINEYKIILKLDSNYKVYNALRLLSMKPDFANFEKCPCGCSNPYLACTYRKTLEKYRYVATPSWFSEEAIKIFIEIMKNKVI